MIGLAMAAAAVLVLFGAITGFLAVVSLAGRERRRRPA
jgi:hypothetical protein